ncbi:MAG: Ppx/GppA family phosphatase [Ignavibacteriales bacterium]|nr:MAG: Ppx/GppA family phosphatase [Ignavibacteriales bacterium]
MTSETKNVGEEILAVIDCGSNSFHLVIAKILPGGKFEIIQRERTVIRIGAGNTTDKIITDESTARAINTLVKYKSIAESYNASIRAVATSAIRDAVNQKEFLNTVKEKSGITIEVVDGQEEARLIFKGITNAISLKEERTLCIDIGGGSTELIVGEKDKILYLKSFPVGAVRLTQLFFPDYILSDDAVRNCEQYIRNIFNEDIDKIKNVGFTKCVGSSGTVMSSALMVKALTEELPAEFYTINNFLFNRPEFRKVFDAVIKSKTIEERINIAGIDKGRADIIPAGILILNYLFQNLNINEMLVSAYGIREGVIAEYLDFSR